MIWFYFSTLFSPCHFLIAFWVAIYSFFPFLSVPCTWLGPCLLFYLYFYPLQIMRRLEWDIVVGFLLASPGPMTLHPKAPTPAHFSRNFSGVNLLLSSFVLICRMIPFVCLRSCVRSNDCFVLSLYYPSRSLIYPLYAINPPPFHGGLHGYILSLHPLSNLCLLCWADKQGCYQTAYHRQAWRSWPSCIAKTPRFSDFKVSQVTLSDE